MTHWIAGLSQAATNSPVSPPETPTAWAVLGWIRRETQYKLFNASPTINYNQTLNSQVLNPTDSQSFVPVIKGNLGLQDADGDKLTVTVTKAPTNGTVTVNPDGSFVYTPTASEAFTGGTDSFEVTVDDRPGNPAHVNLLTLFSPNGGRTTTQTITLTVKPTSTLATPNEISAEQIAAQILARPDVQAALVAFRAKELAAAQARFPGGVDAENMALLDESVKEFGMAAALQSQATDPTNPQIIQYLVPPHTWNGQTVDGSRVVFDNPDTLYRVVAVNSSSTYVIHGQFVGGVPADFNFSVNAPGGATVANINKKDLVVAPDGTFTITVDGDASSAAPNHLLLTSTANQILIRDTFSDWDTQAPMSLSIERTGGPAANPPATQDQLAAKTIAALNQGGAAFGVFLGQATTIPNPVPGQPGTPKPPNTFLPISTGGAQTLTTQLQTAGNFQLADNQALVITITPNKAGYFVVPVTNDWTITGNYWDEQTSLNIAQATPNSDGTYTIVVSPTDPHVANWVSTGGLNQGTIFLRFQALDPNSTVNPTISTQVVTLDQLGGVLPAGTKYVTDAERQAQIDERKAGYNNRFAPYPQA